MKVKEYCAMHNQAGTAAGSVQRLINPLETRATYPETETLFDTPVRKPKTRIDAAT